MAIETNLDKVPICSNKEKRLVYQDTKRFCLGQGRGSIYNKFFLKFLFRENPSCI